MAKRNAEDDFGFVAPAPAVAGSTPADDPFAELCKPEPTDEVAELREAEALGALEDEFRVLTALRVRHAELKEEAAEVWRKIEAQEARMMAAMEGQGTKQFRSGAGLGGCSISERYDTAVEDEAVFMEWVREHAPELLSVHSQRRTSFVAREFRDRGVPETDPSFPAGLRVSVKQTLRVTTAKRKGE